MIFTSKNFKFIKCLSLMNSKTKNYYPYITFGYDNNLTIDDINNISKDSLNSIENFISTVTTTTPFYPPSSVTLVAIDQTQTISTISGVTSTNSTVRNINMIDLSQGNYFNDTDLTSALLGEISNLNLHFSLKVTYTINKADLTEGLTQINLVKLSSFLNNTNLSDSSVQLQIGTLYELPLMVDFKYPIFNINLQSNEYLSITYLLDF